jgi:hypothetical protein
VFEQNSFEDDALDAQFRQRGFPQLAIFRRKRKEDYSRFNARAESNGEQQRSKTHDG